MCVNWVISVSERIAMRLGVKMKKMAKMAEKWRWILHVMRLDNVIKNYHLRYVWRFQNSDAPCISVILCEKGSKLHIFAKLLTYSFLCDFRLKTLTVKKYYSAVYAPKVADLYSQKHPLITLKPCFYGSKSMFFDSLSILISKRMLTI